MPSPAVLVQRYNRRLQHQSKLIADLERKVAAQAATINTLSAALQHQSYSLQLVSTLFHDRAAETTAKLREPLAKAADAPPVPCACSVSAMAFHQNFSFVSLQFSVLNSNNPPFIPVTPLGASPLGEPFCLLSSLGHESTPEHNPTSISLSTRCYIIP